MLQTLSIRNYALIDSLNITFDKGFSVISGETGAGKSIILGALSLILGERADSAALGSETEKCVVEGVFDLSAYQLQSLFEQFGWIYEEKECILRREIWPNGRSRAFVNDSPVYLNELKELGGRLIDIHSQHQNLLLNNPLFQLRVVDAMAESVPQLTAYEQAYDACRAAEKALTEMRETVRRNKEEEDYLRFQYGVLSEAALQPGEQELLEEELEALSHVEEIKSGLYTALSLLSDDERNVESLLRTTEDALQRIRGVYPKVRSLSERVSSAFLDLKDVREEVSRLFEAVEFDPTRQMLVEERLSMIYDLQKKHALATVAELIALRDTMAEQLDQIDSMDDRLDALRKAFEATRETMVARAEQLTRKRKAALPLLERELQQRLTYLMMPDARCHCRTISKAVPDITGADAIQFLFTANKNRELQPVSQIASGGEMSRLMLCIKAMIAGATSLPTIIFDEIDTGTSGEVADRVGGIMKKMGAQMQVIGITHLPQIASQGDAHFLVYKEETQGNVTTRIKPLTPDERVREIARMLSGAEITEQAIENAKAMMRANQ